MGEVYIFNIFKHIVIACEAKQSSSKANTYGFLRARTLAMTEVRWVF